MELLQNTLRGGGKIAENAPFPSVDETRVEVLLRHFDGDVTTPLVDANRLASVGAFWVKDEEEFMDGMIAIAVPVVDPQGRFVAAVAYHGPTQRMTLNEAVERKDLLLVAAEKLSTVLFQVD